VPKPCPKCGTPYLLVRERKAGAFYVCNEEKCGFEAAADDLDRYPVRTEVTEAARQAALEAAKPKAAPKRRRRKAEPEPAASPAPRPARPKKSPSRSAKGGTHKVAARASGRRPRR